MLALVSWQVAVGGPLLGLDRWVRQTVRSAHQEVPGGLFDRLGHALSDLGSSVPAVPVLLAAGVLAAWRWRRTGARTESGSGPGTDAGTGPGTATRHWWLPLPVAALTAGLIPLLVVPAKAVFARPGPSGDPLTPEQWGWYPSGHTATASLAYGVAALLLARTVRPRAARRLAAGAVLLAVGVGAGLVWSDFHWLLDVVASWCLAVLVLWGLARRLPRRARRSGPGPGADPGAVPDQLRPSPGNGSPMTDRR
ncbi:phosphatase PAP2 family protein [Kitasatospora sp. NPDC097643]|uniref:phosphatase PAP2 family protein n=1 Tax=Kitasatospora sp. NPDC097643 TaxID=3157230 RepID=UPI0033214E94